jgi:hypothetical protein
MPLSALARLTRPMIRDDLQHGSRRQISLEENFYETCDESLLV